MKKIKVTAQQRANALEARDVMWPSVPETNVIRNLSDWTAGDHRSTNCNTIACFGGWCARWPGFRLQGATLGAWGTPRVVDDRNSGPSDVSRLLFGAWLFSSRRSLSDDDMGLGKFHGTDHELVTARLNWLIENSEVIS